MLKKRLQWRLWMVFLIAAVILGGLYYYGVFARQKKNPAAYSVILYQNTLDEWTTLVEGAAQAEEDLELDVNYVYFSSDDTAQEQAAVIRREINAGASGILLAAVDSEGVREALGTTVFSIPVVCVETGAGEEFPVIRADDRAMGRALGRAILKDMDRSGGKRRVMVLKEYMQRDSVRLRYEGLMEVLKAAEERVVIEECTRQDKKSDIGRLVGKKLQDEPPYLVALDKYVTEQAAEVWEAERQKYEKKGFVCKIYGIGNTAKTVNDLDNENIEALIYQNEFNMGYQGITYLAEERKKSWIDKNVNIRYGVVTRESLYEDENQRLLFPNT